MLGSPLRDVPAQAPLIAMPNSTTKPNDKFLAFEQREMRCTQSIGNRTPHRRVKAGKLKQAAEQRYRAALAFVKRENQNPDLSNL